MNWIWKKHGWANPHAIASSGTTGLSITPLFLTLVGPVAPTSPASDPHAQCVRHNGQRRIHYAGRHREASIYDVEIVHIISGVQFLWDYSVGIGGAALLGHGAGGPASPSYPA